MKPFQSREVFWICTLSIYLAGCGGEYEAYIYQLRAGDAQEREDAAAFLGAQQVQKGIPALRMALRDPVLEVRVKAIWALGMLRAKRAMRDLLPLLRDPERRVRQTTAWALMQVEEPEAIPALRVAFKMEKDVWVQGDLKRSIGYLQQFQGDADLNESVFR